jgi:hypothetical protein
MVQFVTLPRTRSVGEAIAEGLGQGISEGVSMGLQERMEVRREERKQEGVKKNILDYAQAKADKLGIGSNKAVVGFLYQTGLIDPKSMVAWDPSPEELEHLQGDLKEHLSDSFAPEAEQDGKPITPGNIDLANRPRVRNPDGSISTVASRSYNIDGKEVLLPTVSEDGRIMDDQETVEQYKKTGKHLGIFNSPEEATKYAKQLHEDQAKLIQQDSGQQAQHPMEQGFNLQSSRRGLPNAPGSTTVNPLAVPPSQIGPQQPGTIKGPAEAPPFPKPAIPPSDEDRFRTVRIKGKDIQVVKSPKDVRTLEEAHAYADTVLPESKRKDFMTSARADINAREKEQKIPILKQQLELKQKAFEAEEKEKEHKKIEPLIKEIDDARESVLIQKADIDLQENIVREGDTDSLVQYLASHYNWEPGKSPSASMLDTLNKELLTGSLKGIKAKALNQFIEQRINRMFATIGRSKESNLSTLETLRFFSDLASEKIRLFDELKGKVPNEDLSKEIYKKLGDYAENRKEKFSEKLSEIKDEFSSDVELKSTKRPPEGTYMTKRRRDALYKILGTAKKVQETALKLGYKTPGE